MTLLLDTHIFLAVQDQDSVKLTAEMRAAISAALPNVFVSTASLWEIAIKFEKGKLKLFTALENLPATCAQLGLAILLIESKHVLCKLFSEPSTKDPFDRLLLAQAQVEDMQLMTIDLALKTHPLAWKPKKS